MDVEAVGQTGEERFDDDVVHGQTGLQAPEETKIPTASVLRSKSKIVPV